MLNLVFVRSISWKTDGIVIPDLTSKKNVGTLRDWNGEDKFLSHIQLSKFKAKPKEEEKPNDIALKMVDENE